MACDCTTSLDGHDGIPPLRAVGGDYPQADAGGSRPQSLASLYGKLISLVSGSEVPAPLANRTVTDRMSLRVPLTFTGCVYEKVLPPVSIEPVLENHAPNAEPTGSVNEAVPMLVPSNKKIAWSTRSDDA